MKLDRTEFDAEISVSTYRVDDALYTVATIRDITDRKLAEHTLLRMQSNLAALIESTDDLVCSVDADIRLMTFNRAVVRALHEAHGTEPRVGAGFNDLFPPQIAPIWSAMFERALTEGAYRKEFKTIKGDNILELSFNPIVIDGRTIGASLFGKDITDRKRTEQELRDSEKKLRAVFESALDAVGVSRKGIIVFVNPAYIKLFGYRDAEQVVGCPIADSMAICDRERVVQRAMARSAGEQVADFFEARCVRLDGTEFDAEFGVSTYESDGALYSVATIPISPLANAPNKNCERANIGFGQSLKARRMQLVSPSVVDMFCEPRFA